MKKRLTQGYRYRKRYKLGKPLVYKSSAIEYFHLS